VEPDFIVDIGSVIEEKTRMLAFHESQKRWLDESQGFDSYLNEMRAIAARVGSRRQLAYAEGWRRHSHLGYSARDWDPLAELLRPYRRE
jgi:LmbE family N-acetylglucosaminyl deacetylase